MIAECEGIIIRQTKILGGRRMLLMLTDKFGKISGGTSISERGKSKSALALRPFTHGRYRFKSSNGYTTITSGEVINSHIELGENYERYTNASYALEFTSKIIPEETIDVDLGEGYLFLLLRDYLNIIEKRKKSFLTLTNAYIIKILDYSGVLPEVDNFEHEELISTLDSDIVNLLFFFRDNPLGRIEKLAMDSEKSAQLLKFLATYAMQHLDIGPLKCELPKGD